MSAEITGSLARVGALAVLSRLLTPSDFGLVAMVTAFTVLAERFKDLGLSDATVQAEQVEQQQVSNLFWINLAICTGITVLLAGAAPVIAWFYHDSRLVLVTMSIGVTFIFSGSVIQHQALLRRTMRFGELAIVQLSSVLVSQAVAILVAYLGGGYWALVAREFTRAVLVWLGTWLLLPWLPSRPNRSGAHRQLLRFGYDVTLFNLIVFFALNIDKVFLGRFRGPRDVGLYVNSYKTFSMSINQVQYPIRSVALSALSRLQSKPAEFSEYYRSMLNLLTFLTMPLAVLVTVFADVAIAILLGDQWADAVPVLLALAIGSFVEPISQSIGPVMLGLGRTKRYVRLGIVTSAFLVAAIATGSLWGPVGTALGRSVGMVFAVTLSLLYGLSATPVRLTPVLIDIVQTAGISIIAGAVTAGLRYALGWHLGISLVLVVAVLGIATYLSLWCVTESGRSKLRSYGRGVRQILIRRNNKEPDL